MYKCLMILLIIGLFISCSLPDSEPEYVSKSELDKYDLTTEQGLLSAINDPAYLELVKLYFETNSIHRSILQNQPKLGDVNNYGSITIVDALLTAQYTVEIDVPGFNKLVADVNLGKEKQRQRLLM